MTSPNSEFPSYKPGVFYFRRSLRHAASRDRAIEIGITVCGELERLRDWVRAQGMIPPKWIVDPDEAKDKGWEVGA